MPKPTSILFVGEIQPLRAQRGQCDISRGFELLHVSAEQLERLGHPNVGRECAQQSQGLALNARAASAKTNVDRMHNKYSGLRMKQKGVRTSVQVGENQTTFTPQQHASGQTSHTRRATECAADCDFAPVRARPSRRRPRSLSHGGCRRDRPCRANQSPARDWGKQNQQYIAQNRAKVRG